MNSKNADSVYCEKLILDIEIVLCIGGSRERLGEEKWRFQAEMLRAECNFLRMEREFALKKLERNRVKMEKTLRSAVQTLISVSIFFSLFLESILSSLY